MLVIVPVVSPDRSCSIPNLMDAMERACEKFSPGANHSLLIVCAPDAKQYGEVLLNKLQKYFSQSSMETFVANHALGWPRENNFYFQQSCYLLPKYVKPTQGFLYMELDCVPLTANWLTLLEQEYYADAQMAHAENRPIRRFLGAKEDTYKPSYGEKLIEGYNMVSSGIYPGDFHQCPVLKSLPSTPNYFPIHIKWYPIKGLSISPLIQNNRQTTNYREESSKIICDSLADNPWNAHWNEPIADTTVLLRGCLDGTLIDVVDASRVANVPERKAVVIPAPQTYQQIAKATPPPSMAAQQDIQQTIVTHEKLPPPVVKKFGELVATSSRSAQVEFDDAGRSRPAAQEAAPIVEVQEPVVVTPPKVEEVAQAEAPKSPAPRRSRRDARKNAWTPERRAKQAEIFKARMEAKRAAKQPELAEV